MARYFAIKNGKIHSIATFEETPVNTLDTTFIEYTPLYQMGDSYDIDTDTRTSEVLKSNGVSVSTLQISSSVSEANNLNAGEYSLVGLYTTGSEGEVTDATTHSISITFNRDIQELSQSYWQMDGLISDYTSTPNGCTFNWKLLTKEATEFKRIKISPSHIKDLSGNLVHEGYQGEHTFTYLPILSGSIDL